MKAFIVAALFVGLTVAQTQTTYDGSASFCAAANETTACANYTESCCGTVSTKIGAAAATSVTRCISRRLTEAVPTSWYMSGTNNVTLTYSCLTTKPTNYTTYATCVNSSSCSSGQCCANQVQTVLNRGAANLTSTVCVPGDLGRDSGTNVTHKYNSASNQADIGVLSVCYQSLNTAFYANGVLLKSGFALAMVALLSFFSF